MVDKYYEIMKSKRIFWDVKIVFSPQIKAKKKRQNLNNLE